MLSKLIIAMGHASKHYHKDHVHAVVHGPGGAGGLRGEVGGLEFCSTVL